MCICVFPLSFHPALTLLSLEVINLAINILEAEGEVDEGIMTLGLLFSYVYSYN